MTTKVRLTVFDAGTFTMSKADLMYGGSGMITIPSTVAVIEHAHHGLILFDTGINYRVADPDSGEDYWGPGLRSAYGAQGFTREQAVDAQLVRLGFQLTDVAYVIYSHLHLDHAGGMGSFPHAVHVVQHDELRHAWWPDRWTRRGYALNDYLGSRDFDFLELSGDVDLFGDGTLRLVRTPGHSPGHQSLILTLDHHGPVGLMGDAAHLQEALDNGVPMVSDWNIGEKMRTYQRLRAYQRQGMPVFLSHEPAHYATLPHDGDYWD
ncbi:MAG TPA: N-acyl homoserine lactonase family protein [Actinopolymorphaceae bacterium]